MTAVGRRDVVTLPEDPGRVTVKDLGRIAQIQALLTTLNDPRAGADALARHVASIPVLKARVQQRFLQHHPNWTKHALAQQIALLGNRELEAILLGVLEDVIALHCDVQPNTRYNF